MNNTELLITWDAGKPITTVSMGGLGDDYEQHIHAIGMEMLRYYEATPPEVKWLEEETRSEYEDEWKTYIGEMDDQLLSDPVTEGSSDAQYGAAKNLATVFWRQGYETAMKIAPQDRIIEVTKP